MRLKYRNLEIKEYLIEIVGLRTERDQRSSAKEILKWGRTLSKKEWKITRELKQFLGRYQRNFIDTPEYAQMAMVVWQSSSEPTISQVAPYVIGMKRRCQPFLKSKYPAIGRVAKIFLQELHSKFEPVLNHSIYSIATLVDPQTKKLFLILPSHIQETVKTWIKEQLPTTTESTGMNTQNKY